MTWAKHEGYHQAFVNGPGPDMSRLGALRPYSMLLLVPLWMAGGMAMHSGHRLLGLAAMAAMLVLVLDSAMADTRRNWPFRRSVMMGSALAASLACILAMTGCIPG